MVNALLSPNYDNYTIIPIPDSAHIPEYQNGQKWKAYMIDHFGTLDHFVSGNEYVKNLLQ